MTAEILAVGSELLTPEKQDTNSLWLTAQLNGLGVEVVQKSIIGDDLARLSAGIRDALRRAEILIVTGGLGPTEDDLTRQAAADAIGRQLCFQEEILKAIEERFARLKRKMAEINRRQAYLVDGAEKLPNPNGTAPGQWIDVDGGRILLLLPGPPSELKPMFENEVLPRLCRRLPAAVIRTLCYRVAGMPESELDQLIAPVYKPYTNPVTTILAAAGDIQIHLRARCATAEEAESLVQEVGAKITALLGDRIYSTNGDSLEVTVGRLLAAAQRTIAVAESCTGGLLAARLTDVAGSSKYFRGGFVVYNVELKTSLLGVDQSLIEAHGVVSEPVAEAMAAAARKRTRSDYAISITGEAGPEPATPGVDPGTVWIGIAGPSGAKAQLFRFPGNRARVRGFAVQTALSLLRRELI